MLGYHYDNKPTLLKLPHDWSFRLLELFATPALKVDENRWTPERGIETVPWRLSTHGPRGPHV